MRKNQSLQAPRLNELENIEAPSRLDERTVIENARVENANWRDGEAARVEFWNCELQNCVLGPGEAQKWQFTDVQFQNCDFSGLICTELDARRCEFTGGQMLGFAANQGRFCDTLFQNTALLRAQFRFGRFERARFENCVLRGADFAGADLRNVVFQDCDLRECDFSNAKLGGADVRGCPVEGLRLDIAAARGLIIEPMQAAFLAKNLGLDVRWD